MIVGGQLVFVLSMLALLPLSATTPIWLLLVLLIPLSTGGAILVPALTGLLMNSVPAERTGTASGVFNAVRQTGGALAVALFGALIAQDGTDFSLAGLRTGLITVAALLLVTAALSRWLLPKR